MRLETWTTMTKEFCFVDKGDRWMYIKRPVYIIAFGVYNSKEVNFGSIQHYLVQMQGQEFRMENLNAANITCLELYTPNANIYTGLLSQKETDIDLF